MRIFYFYDPEIQTGLSAIAVHIHVSGKQNDRHTVIEVWSIAEYVHKCNKDLLPLFTA